MKSLSLLLLVATIGCKQDKQVAPAPCTPIQWPTTATTEVQITSSGVFAPDTYDPDLFADYVPTLETRSAYNFVHAHHCEHRHHPTTKDWDSVKQKLMDRDAYDAYDCDEVESTIIVHEAHK